MSIETRTERQVNLSGFRAIGFAALFLLGGCTIPDQVEKGSKRVSFPALAQRFCKGSVSVDGYLTFTRVSSEFAMGLERVYPGAKIYPYVLHEGSNLTSPSIVAIKLREPLKELKSREDALRRKLTVTGELNVIPLSDSNQVCVLKISAVR